MEASESRQVPSWLSLDASQFRGEVLRVPTRDEIAPVVNEQLVVELYSK
jgi:small subunit ribosomal protein S4